MPEYDDATMLADAKAAAEYFHANRPDHGGRLAHVERTVALIPAGHGVLCEATAYLHHVPEDITGMHPAITGAHRALRPRPGEAPTDHFRRIADNAIAVCVFRTHMLDNYRRAIEDPTHPAMARAIDQYLVADNWFTRHVLGYESIVNETAARAAGGDGAEYVYPHASTMPREVLDKLDAIAQGVGISTTIGGPLRDSIITAARRAIDEALVVVSAQIREDLAGLADEQEPSNYGEDDYPAGYRHAMVDAAQLRSLS